MNFKKEFSISVMHTSMVFTTTDGTRRQRRTSFAFGKEGAPAVAAVSSLSFAANGDLIIHAEMGVYVKKMCVCADVCMHARHCSRLRPRCPRCRKTALNVDIN